MTQVSSSVQIEKGHSKFVQAAGVGAAFMGASVAHMDTGIDHGYSAARWTGVLISMAGFVGAGIGLPLRMWPLVALGAALQVVAVVVALLMNKAGLGHDNNRRWAELKAQARAERQSTLDNAR